MRYFSVKRGMELRFGIQRLNFPFLAARARDASANPFATQEAKIAAGSPARRGRHENQDYRYNDHLGNIRMNYAFDKPDGQVKILKEDHYYPFGLIHKNYNSGQLDFGRDEESAVLQLRQVPSNPNVYKYKYQGQELQDELGLGWYAFKWRNYDPSIGRFVTVDPLTSKYPYNSPYAIQENKMGMGRELEGLELVKMAGNPQLQMTVNVGRADAANARLATQGYNNPAPYTPGTSTQTFTTPEGQVTTYARVSTGDMAPSGRWMVDKADIQGLTPKEIQAKLNLGYEPTQVSDVNVPGGAKITAGEINGSSVEGTIQYELRTEIPADSFTNTQPIDSLMTEVLPTVDVIPATEMPIETPVIEPMPIVEPIEIPITP